MFFSGIIVCKEKINKLSCIYKHLFACKQTFAFELQSSKRVNIEETFVFCALLLISSLGKGL